MRGLARLAPPGTGIDRIEVRRRDLRSPIPKRFAAQLTGTTIRGYRRWGKYLLWETTGPTLLSHLGMSGIWRDATGREDWTHDHVYLHLTGPRRLAYHDPRRFGFLDVREPGLWSPKFCVGAAHCGVP